MALLTIAPDEESLAAGAADRFTALVGDAVRAHGEAAVCLTGGRTPKRLYELLAENPRRHQVAWHRLQLYWSDERYVPPDHPDSNYRMANEALLMRVPVPASRVHRIRTELPPQQAAQQYELGLPARFDLVLLGMGEDTHIASIFPGSPLVDESKRRAAAVWAPHLAAYRVTLTPPSLLDARHILVVVSGAGKMAAVAAALHAPADVARHPAHLLREAGPRVEWFIDRAAAPDERERRE